MMMQKSTVLFLYKMAAMAVNNESFAAETAAEPDNVYIKSGKDRTIYIAL